MSEPEYVEYIGRTRRRFRRAVIAALLVLAGVGGYYAAQKFHEADQKSKTVAEPLTPDSSRSSESEESESESEEEAIEGLMRELDSIPSIPNSAGLGMERIGRPPTVEEQVQCIMNAIDFELGKVDPKVQKELMKIIRAILWKTGLWTKKELEEMPDSAVYRYYKDPSTFRDVSSFANRYGPDFVFVPPRFILNLDLGSLANVYDKAGSDSRAAYK